MPGTPWMSMRAVAIAIGAAVCVQWQPVARVDAAGDAAQNPAAAPRFEGELLLAGRTSSDDFPVSPGAIQNRHRGEGDAFLVKLAPCAAR